MPIECKVEIEVGTLRLHGGDNNEREIKFAWKERPPVEVGSLEQGLESYEGR